eukprot:TRINITY_DN69708_c0_g1_i1.p1 TRINITY_DN69708_c0_g1~~TRINITY_DN69708_c0_g1_i1.p1  ORF type:complete len:474 (-),score=77.21 TRINITY_DN69708_c0_g1_i1:105-1526(-)
MGQASPQPRLMSFGPKGVYTLLRHGALHTPDVLPNSMCEENCLNLQLYVPRSATVSKPVPVLVFIHGGMFIFGSGRDTIYQHKGGCKFAEKQGIAVALVGYRLGPFGFLKVPGGEPNLGVHDVMAALKWIQDLGSHFFIDTQLVTVSGESAGAMITGALLRAPSARGLFRRVVKMSGTLENCLRMEDAELLGKHLSEKIDVWTSPPSKLLNAAAMMARGSEFGPMPFQPVADGSFLLSEPCAVDVDVLMGVTDEEFLLFMPAFPLPKIVQGGRPDASVLEKQLNRLLGPECIDVSATPSEISCAVDLLKDCDRSKTKRDAFRRLGSCAVFEAPMLLAAGKLMQSNRVYLYRNKLGPGHGGELGYIFGTWNSNRLIRSVSGLSFFQLSEVDAAAGLAMENLWGQVLNSFIREGRPSEDWPLFGLGGTRLAMALNATGAAVVPAAGPLAEKLALLMQRKRRPFGVRMPGLLESKL